VPPGRGSKVPSTSWDRDPQGELFETCLWRILNHLARIGWVVIPPKGPLGLLRDRYAAKD
jgi:hypothetical protein